MSDQDNLENIIDLKRIQADILDALSILLHPEHLNSIIDSDDVQHLLHTFLSVNMTVKDILTELQNENNN